MVTSLIVNLLGQAINKIREFKNKTISKKRKKRKVELMSQNYSRRKGFRINDSKFSIKKGRNCSEVFVNLAQMILGELISVKRAAKLCKQKGNLRSHYLCLNEKSSLMPSERAAFSSTLNLFISLINNSLQYQL